MPIRLLLVDDHRLLREVLSRSLREADFDVVGEADDGESAVKEAKRLAPDAVLMDVTMPHMDGITATREITENNPDTAVVMLTMHADEKTTAEALAAGAVGYLVKDCSTEEIISTLTTAVSGETVVTAELANAMLDEVTDSPAETGDLAAPDGIAAAVTRREVQILQLIADGSSTEEVAQQLFISQKTVKNHLASIYQKLDARDRTQAVLSAVRRGIVRLR